MNKYLIMVLQLLLLLGILLGVPELYYLPSIGSRLVIFLIFSMLLCVLEFFAIKKRVDFRLLILFVMISSSSFLIYRMGTLQSLLEGVSEIRLFAQSYAAEGILVFNNPHSYFFMTPLLVYVISVLCGISTAYANLVVMALYVFCLGLGGLYFLKVTNSRCSGKSILLMVGGLSFLLSAALIGPFTYRDLASVLFLYMMCFLLYRGFESTSTVVAVLIMVLGITLGSPIAALLMILMFSLFAVIRRRLSPMAYALIPLSYITFVGYSYISSLMAYSSYAWKGFQDFFNQLLISQLPQRVVPWNRTTIPTVGDTYLASLTYLSLLALSGLAILLFSFASWKSKAFSEQNDTRALLFSVYACLFLTVVITAFAYTGASVSPEVPFSDIRTISVLFIILLLPFLFTSKKMLRISTKQVLSIIIISLLIFSSLKTVSEAYPKSINDPINVVEDPRVDTRSSYYAGIFLSKFQEGGSVVLDYKIYNSIYTYLSGNYSVGILSESKIPTGSTLVFDLNGIEYGSLYVSPKAYSGAYNLSLSKNQVYCSGDIVVVINTPP